MGKALSAVRMVLSTMVGAIAGGLIPLSTYTPAEPPLPPSDPPPVVEPRARLWPQARPLTLNEPPAATLVRHPPQLPHDAGRFAVRPAIAIRPIANKANISPTKVPTAPRAAVLLKADIPAADPAPASLSTRPSCSDCRPFLNRLGRGLIRNRGCRWR